MNIVWGSNFIRVSVSKTISMELANESRLWSKSQLCGCPCKDDLDSITRVSFPLSIELEVDEINLVHNMGTPKRRRILWRYVSEQFRSPGCCGFDRLSPEVIYHFVYSQCTRIDEHCLGKQFHQSVRLKKLSMELANENRLWSNSQLSGCPCKDDLDSIMRVSFPLSIEWSRLR